MSRFLARVESGVVTRVIVCDDPAWATARLGGEWVETIKSDAAERYCGPGYGMDDTFPEKFAPPWVQPEGAHDALPLGALRWHNGRMWRSTTPDNVWEPGVSGWHDQPLDDSAPQWVQPTGGHDAYQTGDRVTHPDRANTMSTGTDTIWVWRSTYTGNTTEPGQDGQFHRYWEPIEQA